MPKKTKALQIVGKYTLKPDTAMLDFDSIQFHAPGGVPMFEVRINGSHIEVRGLGGMEDGELAVIPHVANQVAIKVIK